MNSSKVSLAGAYPPIPTPFGPDGQVAHDQLTSNLRRWCETSLDGFVVLGSNGEYVFLSEEEKLAVWATARKAIPQGKRFIAGTGCESTLHTIQLTVRAAELGADAVLVVTPNYYKSRMDGPALVHHYRAVAEASPIPVIIYNVPAFTGIDLSAEAIAMAAEHPNVIGVKESSGNLPKLADIIRLSPPGFQVLAGSASFLYPAMCTGAVGGVMALASVAPEACAKLYRLSKEGQHEEARRLQLRLLAPNAMVTSRFGVPGLKYALDLVGYYGGLPRPPLLPLTEAQREEVRRVFQEAGLLKS